jgi:hypothetical protein
MSDLQEQGYVFLTENTAPDYVYKLVSINGVPPEKSALTHEDHLRIAKDAVAAFAAISEPPIASAEPQDPSTGRMLQR